MALKSSFCAKCGKITKSLTNSLCADCYLDENPIKIPRSLTLKVCPKCGAVLWKSLWLRAKQEPERYFQKLIEQKIKFPREATLVRAEVLEIGKQGGVKLVFHMNGELIERNVAATLIVNKFACPECSRQHSDWLAKVQVRNKPIDTIMASAVPFKHKMIKIEQRGNGIDIYFFDKSSANKLANRLKKQLHMSVKKTYEQHGHDFDTGKPRHREIIALR